MNRALPRKIKCFHMPPSVGRTVIDINDPFDRAQSFLVSQIRLWANRAKPGEQFTLTAARFTRAEIDGMAEFDEGNQEE